MTTRPDNIEITARKRLEAIWSFYLAHYVEPSLPVPEFMVWFDRHRTELESRIRSGPIVAAAVGMRSFLMAGGSLRLSALGQDSMAPARTKAIRDLDSLIFDYVGVLTTVERDLLTLGQEYQFLNGELLQVTLRRNAAIKRCHARGMSLRAIAQLAQVDHTRVKQIIDAKPVEPLDGSDAEVLSVPPKAERIT